LASEIQIDEFMFQMSGKFLFINLPAPLFIKEGILSSFHY